MTRIHRFTIGACLTCATCVWFTASRAEEKSVVPAPTDQVALLVARIEKLEKRIAVLEEREQATRQVNAAFSPWTPRALPSDSYQGGSIVPPPSAEPARPKPRFLLLQHVERTKQ